MPEPVLYFNRYTRQIETEAIYGEGFVRWAYENPLGKLTTALFIKRAFFSKWYGWRMNRPVSREKIAPFLAQYQVSTDDMMEAPESFAHFNAFFCRKLKPSARPIATEPGSVVFPADGRHFVIPDLAANDGIFVKGIRFNLTSLLRDGALAEKFKHGSMIISRLCPVDYHRFHLPCDGTPGAPKFINGSLYSVSPIALRQHPTLLWENKRCLTRFQTAGLGEVLLLEVGATCVGTIVHTHASGQPAQKGDEKGYFLFGGSCFITLFEEGKIKLADDLLEQSAEGREVYARMGDVAGYAVG